MHSLKNETSGSRQNLSCSFEAIPSVFCYIVFSPSESNICLQKKGCNPSAKQEVPTTVMCSASPRALSASAAYCFRGQDRCSSDRWPLHNGTSVWQMLSCQVALMIWKETDVSLIAVIKGEGCVIPLFVWRWISLKPLKQHTGNQGYEKQGLVYHVGSRKWFAREQ